MQAQLQPTVLNVTTSESSATVDMYVPDSPWFEGHFDTSPVLPGVALTLWAKSAFKEQLSINVATQIRRVKFRRAVGPESKMQLRLSVGRRLTFSYHAADGTLVCSGEFPAAQNSV